MKTTLVRLLIFIIAFCLFYFFRGHNELAAAVYSFIVLYIIEPGVSETLSK